MIYCHLSTLLEVQIGLQVSLEAWILYLLTSRGLQTDNRRITENQVMRKVESRNIMQ